MHIVGVDCIVGVFTIDKWSRRRQLLISTASIGILMTGMTVLGKFQEKEGEEIDKNKEYNSTLYMQVLFVLRGMFFHGFHSSPTQIPVDILV